MERRAETRRPVTWTRRSAATLPPMAGCCPSRDYQRFFNQRFARRLANRYRKRGLDKTARTMVQFLQGLGVEGASVLEIGGGGGAGRPRGPAPSGVLLPRLPSPAGRRRRPCPPRPGLQLPTPQPALPRL